MAPDGINPSTSPGRHPTRPVNVGQVQRLPLDSEVRTRRDLRDASSRQGAGTAQGKARGHPPRPTNAERNLPAIPTRHMLREPTSTARASGCNRALFSFSASWVTRPTARSSRCRLSATAWQRNLPLKGPGHARQSARWPLACCTILPGAFRVRASDPLIGVLTVETK